jgi:hypothetical protein
MTSSCNVRNRLAEKFAVAARLYAESAVCLATSGKSGHDFTRLSKQTIEAQSHSEVAFKALMEHVASHPCGVPTQTANGHLNVQEEDVS